jgi:tetratricopeptide (TPR) repeat protein
MRKLATLALLTMMWIDVGWAQAPTETVDPRMDELGTRMQAGEFQEALTLLESMSQEGDLPVQLQGLMGALYVETGNVQRGFDILMPLTEDANADPAILYNAGRAAFNLGDYQTAEALLGRSLSLSPGSPAVREMGIILAQTGRFREGYQLLRSWATSTPEDTEARIVAALCAIQLDRPSEAETLLSDLDQNNPRVRMLWGKLLLDKADPYGAIATLNPLTDNPPPELKLDVYRTLAEAHATVGQSAEAIALLEGLEEGNPSVALQLAQAKYQGGDLDGAITTLRPYADTLLSQLPPEGLPPGGAMLLSIIVEYGRLLATGGHTDEAIPYLEAATRLDPDLKQSWQQLGQAYAAAGRREEAQEALKNFQQIVESEVPGAMKDLQLEADVDDPTGRVLREATKAYYDGQTEEAFNMLREEARLSAGDPRPMLLGARFLLLSERADEALALAEQSIEMVPNNADGYYIKGTILMAMRQFPEAEAEFQRALQIAPDHAATMNDFAVLMMEQGRNDEARSLLQRVLEMRPDDEIAAGNLESLGPPS